MKLRLLRLSIVFVVTLLGTVTASAQDFQKTYKLEPDSSVRIQSVSGKITVVGYDGAEIIARGYKEGPNRDLVTIVDRSNSNTLDLVARYPENCRCNADVRFEVQVPRSIKYDFRKISTSSGDIEVRDITGELNAKSSSGNIKITGFTGSVTATSSSGKVTIMGSLEHVNAKSSSGGVEAEVSASEGDGNLTFESSSGNVTVRVPADLDAFVRMSTTRGSLSTDFPIETQDQEYGNGRHARGKLGSGSRSLVITSSSGNVSLKRM